MHTHAAQTAGPDQKAWHFLDYFYHWEKTRPEAIYLQQPQDRRYLSYSWAETGRQARQMVTALRGLGLPPQARIGIYSKNCAHWIIADLAIKMGGWVSVPFYPNLTATQLQEVLTHSGCQVLFVGKLDDLSPAYEGVPAGVRRIALPLCSATDLDRWDDIIAGQAPAQDPYVPQPQDIETIVYTSGTTGSPKGVVKTFGAMSAVIEPVRHVTKIDQIEGRFFSYLPLNHDAERAVVEGGSLLNGGTVYFAESLDTFMDDLRQARPTVFLAVPRIWTRFQMGILEKLPQDKLDRLLRLPLVSGLIKKRIQKQLGLDQLILAISGAAPIPPATLSWFQRLGIAIHEAYGMTENNAICTINPPGAIRIGTVGQPYPGCELKIAPGTDEVLVRCPWNMEGYLDYPEATAEMLRDGWLHTGDLGEITAEGYLRITGRVKDKFKTAKGEYVLPVPMEQMFASNTLIEQVCVTGYGLPQPFALVNLSESARHLDEAEVVESLEATLQAVNESVADYERIHRVVITAGLWTVENGLLTPTLKVRRHILDSRYRVRMEQWYASGTEERIIWES